MALNTGLGWAAGDDLRVLIATGLSIGRYQVQQIQGDMNYMGVQFPDAVAKVTALLDEWDAAQTQLSEFNSASESRVLTKADVLQWTVASPGSNYSPEREMERIRSLLFQYFGFSQLFGDHSGGMISTTELIRS